MIFFMFWLLVNWGIGCVVKRGHFFFNVLRLIRHALPQLARVDDLCIKVNFDRNQTTFIMEEMMYKHDHSGQRSTAIGLAAGSTATPYQYDVNITQRLCFPCCVSNTPVFAPAFSVASVNQVNTGLYMATIHVEGVISYVPCGGGCCDTKTQPLSADFNILITSTDAPTVTIAPGATINAITVAGCQSCGRTFVSETPLAVTVA